MNRRRLRENFVDNPEAIIRKTRAKLKKVSSSTLQRKASSKPEDSQSFIWNLSTEFEAMANKLIHEFSPPTTDIIRTGPAVEIDRNFELKPRLINMVQANQFCGKAHEDASTFSLYQKSPETPYYFASSHSQCSGERSSGST